MRAGAHQVPEVDVGVTAARGVVQVRQTEVVAVLVGEDPDAGVLGLDDVARREMFRPYSQAAWPVMTVTVKTAGEPAGFATAVRGALQRIDPDLPVSRVTTMETVATNSTRCG